MKKIIALSLIALPLFSVSATSFALDGHAHDVKKASNKKAAENSVKFRKSLLQLVRSNMGPLGAMAKGNIPMDADTIATNAERIAFLGTMMHDYFATDTSSFRVSTESKDDIWTNYEDFSSKSDDMVEAAVALQKIAMDKDEASYRKGIAAVGATCKACHDKYKAD